MNYGIGGDYQMPQTYRAAHRDDMLNNAVVLAATNASTWGMWLQKQYMANS